MNTRNNSPRGFSLLEVLIAVAVLAFGLLALTSLQASLVRNSAQAKARSVGLSVAKDRLEELRAYRTIDEYLTGITDTAPTSVTVGQTVYTVRTTVTRYGYETDPDNNPLTNDGRFVAVANETADPAPGFVDENEFKRVSVKVGWVDASGDDQFVLLEDAIGSVAPENTGKLARREPDAADRKPVILIQDPSIDQGVIPIAIGDGSETAATNPRPDVDTGIALQTSYDIFTFAALLDGSNNATAQSRVETFIVGCRCDFREASNTSLAYRPTYWDGERYVAPDEASYSAQAGEARLSGGDPDQSVLCGACCRDHHDPNGVAGPKFSPRLDNHEHFLDNLGEAITDDEYYEACRMIRVDGIFRVAADPYNEYTNILKTAIASGQTEPFTSPSPDEAAAGEYVDFVIDYLETQAEQPDPNAQLTQAVADQMAATNLLDEDPQEVEIGNERWMHARGLYIDYLEEDALDAIAESDDDCNLTPTQCLLRVLPFTSINLTELSSWTPAVAQGQPVYVANNDFTGSTLANQGVQNPVRGRVTAALTGSAPATASIRTSNTGLLANPTFAISTADGAVQTDNIGDQPDSDGQVFTIAGPNCGAAPVTVSIAAKAVQPFTSSDSCEGSDATKTNAQTVIKLTLTRTVGPSNATIVLISPDNQTYTVGTGSWNSFQTTYSFASVGNPRTAGVWTLQVTNNDNGQADTTTIGFSVEFAYTQSFQATLANYSVVSSTKPSGILSTGGDCSFNNSPTTTCSTTKPATATTITLGTYNYQGTLANQTVTCKRNAANVTCANVIATTCRNFDVVNAVNGAETVTPTTANVSNSGRIGESTALTFNSGFQQGDNLIINMTESAATIASCTTNNNQCSTITWTCPQ